MTDFLFMKDLKSSQELFGNIHRIHLCQSPEVFEVLSQITMLHVLHCEKSVVRILVPAVKLDE